VEPNQEHEPSPESVLPPTRPEASALPPESASAVDLPSQQVQGDDHRSAPRSQSSCAKVLRRLCGVVFGGLLVLGVLLHMSVQDRWGLPWCTIFYGLPRPLLLGLGITAAWCLSPARPGRTTRWGIRAGVACGVIWVLWNDTGWHPSATPGEQNTFTVVSWNAADLPRGRAAAAREIASWNADLIGLVEAGYISNLDLIDWQVRLPGYQAYSLGDRMVWLSRQPLTLKQSHWLQACSQAHEAEWSAGETQVQVLLADMTGQLDLTRQQGLERLGALAADRDQRPLIILGDLNTPDDSVWFQRLKQTCRPAFRVAGRGYAPTWPIPFPLLLLDYVWANRHVKISHCRHGWATCSDHRPVITTVTIDPVPHR
jgi:vancomycin resistance protein VanJ